MSALLHDYSDAEGVVDTRYGKRAQTIVNNHRAKVFATGIADPDTLGFVSRVVGDGEFRERSETAGRRGEASATVASQYRDLAPANVVREAAPGSALLQPEAVEPAAVEEVQAAPESPAAPPAPTPPAVEFGL